MKGFVYSSSVLFLGYLVCLLIRMIVVVELSVLLKYLCIFIKVMLFGCIWWILLMLVVCRDWLLMSLVFRCLVSLVMGMGVENFMVYCLFLLKVKIFNLWWLVWYSFFCRIKVMVIFGCLRYVKSFMCIVVICCSLLSVVW